MSEHIQTLLIVDDDADIGIALAAALERPGRRVVVCRDAETAELVIESEHVDVLVTDVKLSGPFRFEGLDLLDRCRAIEAGIRRIGMSGSRAEGLGVTIELSGAAFLAKPFDVEALEGLIGNPQSARPSEPVLFVPTIEDILAGGHLTPEYQPIVRLDSGEVFGFESLARLTVRSAIARPDALFRYADRKHRSVDLNLVCIARALECGGRLAAAGLLFVNVDGRVFAEGERFADAVRREAEAAGVALDRLILELTEQHPFIDSSAALAAIDALRESGVRIAFDDVGVAYSHLPFIGRLRPSFLKISQQFGTDFQDDPTRTKLVQNVVALARDFDCDVILEGIETAATRDAAIRAGIGFGQGFHFARPQEAAKVRTGAADE